MNTIEIPVWPFVYGEPAGQGRIRTVPEDFMVSETLSFEPSGAGEHALLRIEKICHGFVKRNHGLLI